MPVSAMRKVFMISGGVMSSILDVIAMKRPAYTIGSRTGLRTMFSAGALALLLACAGTAAAGDRVVNLFQKVNEVCDPD